MQNYIYETGVARQMSFPNAFIRWRRNFCFAMYHTKSERNDMHTKNRRISVYPAGFVYWF